MLRDPKFTPNTETGREVESNGTDSPLRTSVGAEGLPLGSDKASPRTLVGADPDRAESPDLFS